MTLLDAGASVNETDLQGNTPLHWASRNEYDSCIATLVQRKADIEAKNDRGDTCIVALAKLGAHFDEREFSFGVLLR